MNASRTVRLRKLGVFALALSSLFSIAEAQNLGLGRRILFVRGGPGTGGFLEGGADEQLSDITDFATNNGNHGWGELAQELTSQGFLLDQLIEGPAANNTPVDFALANLSQYAAVVLGSNNAAYSPAAVTLIEDFVLAGGGLLVISDANWGQNWGDAPTSDQPFLDRFGLIMNQDTGTYSLQRANGDFVVSGTDMGSHPILAGPDGLVGTGDDVDRFDGEGVSPLTLNPGSTGLNPVVLAKAEGNIHVNDSAGSGSFRSSNVSDGALVTVDVGSGRVVGHFDRNTFFNLNGAGTSINRFDNRQYAINLFTFLAGPLPEPFVSFCNGDGGDQLGCTDCPCSNNALVGTDGGCLNESGSSARLMASGMPSVSTDTMRFELTGGNPSTFGILASGLDRLPSNPMNPCTGTGSGVTSPVLNGIRCIGNGVLRHGTRATDANGDIGEINAGWGPPSGPTGGLIAFNGFVAGQTRHFQVFYRETPFGSCLQGQNTSQAISATFSL